MSREEQDIEDMITSRPYLDCGPSLDVAKLAQLLTDFEARIAALETELEVARRKEGA